MLRLKERHAPSAVYVGTYIFRCFIKISEC